MEILNNEESMKFVDGKRKFIEQVKKDRLIFEPFYKDFTYRFCWNSNAIEGNTLSLDETISLLEYDEVRSGHTYSEYEEAKRLNQAISEMLSERYTEITEEWLVKAVHLITGRYKEYRTDDDDRSGLLSAFFLFCSKVDEPVHCRYWFCAGFCKRCY